jgi:hypothetical protein
METKTFWQWCKSVDNKMTYGLFIGIGIGLARGVSLGDWGTGIAIGVGVGIALGAAWSLAAKNERKEQ